MEYQKTVIFLTEGHPFKVDDQSGHSKLIMSPLFGMPFIEWGASGDKCLPCTPGRRAAERFLRMGFGIDRRQVNCPAS